MVSVFRSATEVTPVRVKPALLSIEAFVSVIDARAVEPPPLIFPYVKSASIRFAVSPPADPSESTGSENITVAAEVPTPPSTDSTTGAARSMTFTTGTGEREASALAAPSVNWPAAAVYVMAFFAVPVTDVSSVNMVIYLSFDFAGSMLLVFAVPPPVVVSVSTAAVPPIAQLPALAAIDASTIHSENSSAISSTLPSPSASYCVAETSVGAPPSTNVFAARGDGTGMTRQSHEVLLSTPFGIKAREFPEARLPT